MANKKDESQNITLKEFLSIQKWLFKIFLKEAPVLTVVRTVMVSIKELQGLVSAFILGYIIDQIIKLAGETGDINQVLFPLGVLFASRVFFSLINEIENYSRNLINNKSHFFLESVVYTKIAELGIETVEDPEVANKVQRTSNNIHNLPYFLDSSIQLIGRLTSAIIAGITLATFFIELIPILIVLAIPRIMIETKYLGKTWKLEFDTTEENRKAWWNSSILRQTETLAEVTTTGTYSYFDDRFKGFVNAYLKKLKKIYDSWYSIGFFLSLFSTFVIFGGYFILLQRFIAGVITVGAFTFQIRAIDIFFNDFFWGLFEIFNLRQRAIKFKDAKALFDLEPVYKDGEIILEKKDTPPVIKFQNVSFSYPRTDRKVLNNFDLEIKPGEKVAIVGKNGAGKTTTVKLLSRFYRATEGQILIDGKNINELNSESWYKNLSIVSQEYNRYGHLTVKDNVFVGDITKDPNQTILEDSVVSADAHEFIMDYKEKYDQILSEKFEGGIRPSTGQWQKIALSRFFYRNTPVVIFDEPTAAIDAESEFKIFNRIYEFFENKTVIIISHRFSTVRNADRILVLDEGQIVEDGSHEELMNLIGKYAHAFNLQAKGYE